MINLSNECKKEHNVWTWNELSSWERLLPLEPLANWIRITKMSSQLFFSKLSLSLILKSMKVLSYLATCIFPKTRQNCCGLIAKEEDIRVEVWPVPRFIWNSGPKLLTSSRKRFKLYYQSYLKSSPAEISWQIIKLTSSIKILSNIDSGLLTSSIGNNQIASEIEKLYLEINKFQFNFNKNNFFNIYKWLIELNCQTIKYPQWFAELTNWQ